MQQRFKKIIAGLKMNKSHFIKLFLLLVLSTSALAFGKEKKLILKKSFSVSANQNLLLNCDSGDIEVSAWDKNEVLIQIFGNKKAERYFKFKISQSDSGVELEADKKGSSWFNFFSSISIFYKITVPENFNVNGKTSGGDILLSNIDGKITLKTSGGDIKVDKSKGQFSLHTSGGNIQLKYCSGNAIARTSGGDIVCKNLLGDFSAKTSGGNIYAKLINGKVETKTSGGDITVILSGDNHGINAVTSGGNISLELNPSIKADVKFHCAGGNIQNRAKNLQPEEISSSKLIGKLNGGGSLIECKTSGGDISLSNR